MDYINVATTGTLSPHILPVRDLKEMLTLIEETLPSTLHLSSEDTLHTYQYLCMHVLITNKQFLLLIDLPIQDRSQQLSIYKIFTLDISHGNFTSCYDISTKSLEITQDKTMAVEILPQQFGIFQEANGQFFIISTPFQPLANLLSYITALYARNTASILARCSLQIRKTSDVSMPSQLAPNVWIVTTAPSAVTTEITLICLGKATQFIGVKKPIHVLYLPTDCSATSPNFHLPPHYESSPLEVNISLDMANLNMVNISSLNFHIWQHLDKHWNKSQLQHLASIPSVPVGQLYTHIASGIHHTIPFSSAESTGDTDLICGHCCHIQESM